MSTINPQISVFTIAYNEEKILPYFLNHYSQFATNIIIYDNKSSDNTVNIAKNFNRTHTNVECWGYDTDNQLNDKVYLDIKHSVASRCKTEYCIIVDCDEFLYHPNIKDFINENLDVTVFQPYGFDMVSAEFPNSFQPITQTHTNGTVSDNYSKVCLFKPKQVSSYIFEMGCHKAVFKNINHQIIIPYRHPELKLLHYKNLSFRYRIQKHNEYKNRLSSFNKQTRAGIHYQFDESVQLAEFNTLLKNSTKII